MPEFEKKTLVKSLIQTIIDIISRRTSESYAAVMMNSVFRNLNDEYVFLKDIEIKNPQFNEIFEIVNIKSDLDYVNINQISSFSVDLLKDISDKLGKDAGYFFIREIKETIPSVHLSVFKQIGVDFDLMQLEFYTSRSARYMQNIQNSDVFLHVFKALFDVLDAGKGRDFAFLTINEMINRFSTKYNILDTIIINDIRTVSNIDIISVPSDLNSAKDDEVGEVIQKIIQEINNYLSEKGSFNFIEKLQLRIGNNYAAKLVDMGVNLKAIQLKQEPIVKMIIKSLLDVLSDVSSQSYAVLTFDDALKELRGEYGSLKYITVDSKRYSDGINAVSISSDIEFASRSEVGRGIHKLIEKIVLMLGDAAGMNFLDKLKKRIGKAYLLKIEEMGVNLYMIELKQSLLW